MNDQPVMSDENPYKTEIEPFWNDRKITWLRRLWHGFVAWVITKFLAGLAYTYSIGGSELIESEFGYTADNIVQHWYDYTLLNIPLSVQGTLVDYGEQVRETGRLPGYGPVSGPIIDYILLNNKTTA